MSKVFTERRVNLGRTMAPKRQREFVGTQCDPNAVQQILARARLRRATQGAQTDASPSTPSPPELARTSSRDSTGSGSAPKTSVPTASSLHSNQKTHPDPAAPKRNAALEETASSNKAAKVAPGSQPPSNDGGEGGQGGGKPAAKRSIPVVGGHVQHASKAAKLTGAEATSPTSQQSTSTPLENGKSTTPANLKEVAPAEIKEVAAAKVKEVAPPEVKEVAPEKVKEVAPPEVKEVAPAEVKDVALAEVKEVALPEVKEVGPAEVKEVAPAEVKDVAPADVKVVGFEANEVAPNEIKEVAPETPAEIKQTGFTELAHKADMDFPESFSWGHEWGPARPLRRELSFHKDDSDWDWADSQRDYYGRRGERWWSEGAWNDWSWGWAQHQCYSHPYWGQTSDLRDWRRGRSFNSDAWSDDADADAKGEAACVRNALLSRGSTSDLEGGAPLASPRSSATEAITEEGSPTVEGVVSNMSSLALCSLPAPGHPPTSPREKMPEPTPESQKPAHKTHDSVKEEPSEEPAAVDPLQVERRIREELDALDDETIAEEVSKVPSHPLYPAWLAEELQWEEKTHGVYTFGSQDEREELASFAVWLGLRLEQEEQVERSLEKQMEVPPSILKAPTGTPPKRVTFQDEPTKKEPKGERELRRKNDPDSWKKDKHGNPLNGHALYMKFYRNIRSALFTHRVP